mmetsp:Transcript_90626/g.194329  ORF Transcript_90626/g.194329 Transcript_90626/m.194329 type:complete len:211 (+) Transcript_90626:269-901(+)
MGTSCRTEGSRQWLGGQICFQQPRRCSTTCHRPGCRLTRQCRPRLQHSTRRICSLTALRQCTASRVAPARAVAPPTPMRRRCSKRPRVASRWMPLRLRSQVYHPTQLRRQLQPWGRGQKEFPPSAPTRTYPASAAAAASILRAVAQMGSPASFATSTTTSGQGTGRRLRSSTAASQMKPGRGTKKTELLALALGGKMRRGLESLAWCWRQ